MPGESSSKCRNELGNVKSALAAIVPIHEDPQKPFTFIRTGSDGAGYRRCRREIHVGIFSALLRTSAKNVSLNRSRPKRWVGTMARGCAFKFKCLLRATKWPGESSMPKFRSDGPQRAIRRLGFSPEARPVRLRAQSHKPMRPHPRLGLISRLLLVLPFDLFGLKKREGTEDQKANTHQHEEV